MAYIGFVSVVGMRQLTGPGEPRGTLGQTMSLHECARFRTEWPSCVM